MELKGKCKEDFEKWLAELPIKAILLSYDEFDAGEPYLFKELPNSFKYGVYIDFFDSVGIYIGVNSYEKQKYWIGHAGGLMSKKLKTRHEARTKAIEKAVEIYNSNN